ncbi:MAG: DUF1178 family protein [Rhodobacteraceae bacterium]|nr:DUF1178 family protein [Paracoccaceae bacterium]
MIKFSLNCENSHSFDSWFKSSDAFESLSSTQMLSCPICGSSVVGKSIMAPRIGKHQGAADEPAQTSPTADPTERNANLEKAIVKLKLEVERTSDYVGRRFVEEARAMHSGELPSRSIYGEARMHEARELAEEGIGVMPLPWLSATNTN